MIIRSMVWEYNLLATTERLNESEACSELWMLLRAIGDETPSVDRSPIRGLILAKTKYDPIVAIRNLRSELHENPSNFRVLFRILPIQKWVPTDMEKMKEVVDTLSSRIGKNESFRITLEKRRTNLRSKELIDKIAEDIDRKVNLVHPDWVVLLEIIGRVTGISVVRAEALLNVQKERAKLFI